MKVFSVLGFKGGLTKTTIAANLAAGFARAGLKTVLMDMDGQANSTVLTRCKSEPNVYNLLLGDYEFRDVMQPASPKFTGMDCPLFVISSNPSQSLVDKHDNTPSLIVQRLSEQAIHEWADVIVIDTAPGSTQTHAGVYYASDFIVLPTTLQMFGIQSVAKILQFLKTAADVGRDKGYQPGAVLGIVPNCFDARARIEQSNVGYLRGKYDEHYRVFDPIRKLTVWDQALQLRQSIFTYQPTDDYNARRMARAAVNEFMPLMNAALEQVGVSV